MRKTVYAYLAICAVLLMLINGAACSKLSPDHIKANDHLSKGNENYTKELYKKAIMEYEEALQINPDLKKLYIYIGLAGSTAYKPAVPRPEEDATYGERKAQLEQIEMVVSASQAVVDSFESNEDVKVKLAEIAALETELNQKNTELEAIDGFNAYQRAARDVNSLNRKIEYDRSQIEKKKADEGLKDNDPVIVALQSDITTSEAKIIEYGAVAAKFTTSPLAVPVLAAIKDIEAKIAGVKNVMKGYAGYDEYLVKKAEAEANKRLLGAHNAYLRRSEDNEFFREKAMTYLHKAEEFEPDRDEVTFALSEFYQKLNDIDKAETYYKKIIAKDPENPKNLYIMADFYANNGRPEQAIQSYEERIALDPKNPEGYHYFAGFLHNNRLWERAFDMHQKRIYAMLNPEIIDLTQEVDVLKAELKGLEPFEKLLENLNKNKALSKAIKEQTIKDSLENRKIDGLTKIGEELAQIEAQKAKGKLGKLDEARLAKLTAEKARLESEGVRVREQIEPLIKEKEAVIASMLTEAEAKIEGFDEEAKLALSEAYYAYGQDLWNKSYQTPNDEVIMPREERRQIINKGMEILNKAISLNPDFPNPYSYVGLLYREMTKVEPQNSAALIAKNEEYNKKFIDLYQKKVKAEQYKKTLEELGKE
jgi:tetratricopeptide (TPR) repeat protein